MGLFQKPKAVLWPKAKSFDLYLSRSENNVFTLDINLWNPLSETDLNSFKLLFTQHKIDSLTVLLPDDVVFTKSFMYDSEITTIDKAEVIGLAESFINFKIDPEYIDYTLIPSSGKTLILAHIFDKQKINALEENLNHLNLISKVHKSVSESIAYLINREHQGEYFLLSPNNQNEFTLILAKNNQVYLSTIVKGPELELQKIINYSKLYFSTPTNKLFIPANHELKIKSTTHLEQIPYDSVQMSTTMGQPSNLPLPVLGVIIESSPVNTPVSSSTNSMENKKNILPFIAVFIVTAALASLVIWFVLSRNNSNSETPSIADITPTVVETEVPTEIPTPTLAEISKDIKIQVLNATEINGQAATLKEKLTSLGFASVAVGNSKEKLTTNQIKIKSTLVGAQAYFAQFLAGFFDATVTADLPATSTYDAVFYIGTDLSGNTATTTKTITPTTSVKVTGTSSPTVKPTTSIKPTATPTVSE